MSALLLCAFHAQDVSSQCKGNLFLNGDMNGAEGPYTVANDWEVAFGSPDLNDDIGPLLTTCTCNWAQAPLPSPSGGTWQNILPSEGISQTVPTVIGMLYSICFDYAQQPFVYQSNGKVIDWPWGVMVLVDGEISHSTPLSSDAFVWQSSCVGFMAAASSTTITFAGGGLYGYGAIDGLCMQVDHTNEVQEALRGAPGLFPNPATDQLQVMGSQAAVRATLTNAAGQSMPLELNGYRISLTGVEPGIYTVQCWFAGGGAPLVQRVVVVREQ